MQEQQRMAQQAGMVIQTQPGMMMQPQPGMMIQPQPQQGMMMQPQPAMMMQPGTTTLPWWKISRRGIRRPCARRALPGLAELDRA